MQGQLKYRGKTASVSLDICTALGNMVYTKKIIDVETEHNVTIDLQKLNFKNGL